MATAEVIDFPVAEDKDLHPLTSLVREAREQGLTTDQDVASWILDNDYDFWAGLDRSQRESVLVRAINRWEGAQGRERRASIKGEWGTEEGIDGSRESVMRVCATGSAAWSTTWSDVGGKETRALDQNDILKIKDQYKRRAIEMMARIKWLDALADLMRTHKASTAGALEKKGIALPSITVGAGE